MQKDCKLSPDDYVKVAGSDWPCYVDYCRGNMSKRLALEISKHENKFHAVEQHCAEIDQKNSEISIESTNNQHYSINLKWAIRYLLTCALPAVVAVCLFAYLGGTVEKFIILFFLFRIKKEFWVIVVHKWLCHNQFEPKPWARAVLLFVVVAGSRASPAFYVQSHWAHHQDQDTELDPYPPSWGLLNLMLLGGKYYKTYPLGRWLTASDIKFVFRNLLWLRLVYWTVIAFIDLDILILSFFFMNFYERFSNGLESYLYHDGHRTQQPIDKYPFIGYPIMLFLGSNWMHASHSKKPWQFDCSKSNPDLIDVESCFLRIFVATERT